jgi:hypothetical protein
MNTQQIYAMCDECRSLMKIEGSIAMCTKKDCSIKDEAVALSDLGSSVLNFDRLNQAYQLKIDLQKDIDAREVFQNHPLVFRVLHVLLLLDAV